MPSFHARRIMYLECGITFVAATMYSIFNRPDIAATIFQFLFGNSAENLVHRINVLRYIGWFISTALMLVALCYLLSWNRRDMSWRTLGVVIGLDWMMLGIGLLGEMGVVDKWWAWVLAFLPFFAMFYVLHHTFLRTNANSANQIMYWTYFVLWIMYGVVYSADETIKTVVTNVLDGTAKGVFALAVCVRLLFFS